MARWLALIQIGGIHEKCSPRLLISKRFLPLKNSYVKGEALTLSLFVINFLTVIKST